MSTPVTSIELYSQCNRIEIGKADLRVQEPPGAKLLTGFLPAQDTDELENKKYKVRREFGEDRGFGIHEMTNLTNISSPNPARYGCI